MNQQQKIETIRKKLVEKILACLEGKAPKKQFIEIAKSLNNTPEIHTDTSLLQSFTILDFLAQQLKNGNEDIITPLVIEESCNYILSTLEQRQPYVS